MSESYNPQFAEKTKNPGRPSRPLRVGGGERGTLSPPALAVEVGRLLSQSGQTLALAESCTGGLIGDLITDVPGSSGYFLGSAVCYAYSAKEHILGVRHETLAAHGAVSAETAAEMARGARRIFGADVALSVTGIAGPGGGMPNKPVGLVHIHLSAADAETGERHVWAGDRVGNKRLSAEAVLRLLLAYLTEKAGKPGQARDTEG